MAKATLLDSCFKDLTFFQILLIQINAVSNLKIKMSTSIIKTNNNFNEDTIKGSIIIVNDRDRYIPNTKGY